jgi:flagellar M-ring protein FliF
MEFFTKIKQQVSEFWQSKNRAQKIKILIIGIISICLSLIITYYLKKPSYVPVYSDLSEKEAGEIVKKLDDMKIPYKLDDGGKSILVEPQYKYKTRLQLAQEGLPRDGSMSFDEVFDKTKLGTTDWERQMQYNQALQGELARTIEEIAEIESARVHIVQPEKSLFIQTEPGPEPSAAVILKLEPGVQMNDEQVRGIVFLVTRSVEGLKPDNITVVDNFGRILSDGIDFSQEKASKDVINSQIAIQSKFQEQLQSSVKSLLEQVFGPGNVVVRVSAQLNFDEKTVENKLFDPVDEETGEGIIRSMQELKEHFSGTGSVPQGEPGEGSNPPSYNQTETGDSDYDKSETVKNFEINESHENLKVAQGAVKKLSVSVVINNKELGDEEKESITSIVGNAIGYDPETDQIFVYGTEFNNYLADALAQDATLQKEQKAAKRKMIMLVLVLLAITGFVVYRVILSRKQSRLEEEAIEKELAEVKKAAATEDEELQTRNEVYKNIERNARQNPKEVAKILQTWMNED